MRINFGYTKFLPGSTRAPFVIDLSEAQVPGLCMQYCLVGWVWGHFMSWLIELKLVSCLVAQPYLSCPTGRLHSTFLKTKGTPHHTPDIFLQFGQFLELQIFSKLIVLKYYHNWSSNCVCSYIWVIWICEF